MLTARWMRKKKAEQVEPRTALPNIVIVAAFLGTFGMYTSALSCCDATATAAAFLLKSVCCTLEGSLPVTTSCKAADSSAHVEAAETRDIAR
jgi:hypothetical protein